MFHTIILLAYTIPNVYVFIRIWKLFINKGYKIHYTVIYLLLVSIYPLSNLIAENSGFIRIVLNDSANYILPFFLYLFLFILLYDILLLINYIIPIFDREKLRATQFKTTGLTLILILSWGVVIARDNKF